MIPPSMADQSHLAQKHIFPGAVLLHTADVSSFVASSSVLSNADESWVLIMSYTLNIFKKKQELSN